MCVEPKPKHVNQNQTAIFLSNRFDRKIHLVAENASPKKGHELDLEEDASFTIP
jgi:hypothetical protein